MKPAPHPSFRAMRFLLSIFPSVGREIGPLRRCIPLSLNASVPRPLATCGFSSIASHLTQSCRGSHTSPFSLQRSLTLFAPALLAISSRGITVLAQKHVQMSALLASNASLKTNIIECRKQIDTELMRLKEREADSRLRRLISLSSSTWTEWMLGHWRCAVRMVELLVIFLPVAVTAIVFLLPPSFPRLQQLQDAWWRLLARRLEKGGPTFIKMGQWAATRPDIFPAVFSEKLKKLHHNSCAHSWAATHLSIQNAFGKDPGEIFEVLYETPLASGSVAQVHYGVMKETGLPVVVKVLHPGIEESMSRDLRIILATSSLLDASFPFWSMRACADAFAGMMMAQLNLLKEARNLVRFQANFAGEEDGVRFPLPVAPWVSARVLVEEWLQGEPLGEYLTSKKDQLPLEVRKELARRGLLIFLEMIFCHGFVHADLHPGNMLVIDAHNVCVLDVGCVAEMTPRDEENIRDVFNALALGDGRSAAKLFVERGPSDMQMVRDMPDFERKMGELFAGVVEQPIAEIDLGLIMLEMLKLVRTHNVVLEGHFSVLVTSMITLEGIARQLDPTIGLIEIVLPVLFRERPTELLKLAKERKIAQLYKFKEARRL